MNTALPPRPVSPSPNANVNEARANALFARLGIPTLEEEEPDEIDLLLDRIIDPYRFVVDQVEDSDDDNGSDYADESGAELDDPSYVPAPKRRRPQKRQGQHLAAALDFLVKELHTIWLTDYTLFPMTPKQLIAQETLEHIATNRETVSKTGQLIERWFLARPYSEVVLEGLQKIDKEFDEKKEAEMAEKKRLAALSRTSQTGNSASSSQASSYLLVPPVTTPLSLRPSAHPFVGTAPPPTPEEASQIAHHRSRQLSSMTPSTNPAAPSSSLSTVQSSPKRARNGGTENREPKTPSTPTHSRIMSTCLSYSTSTRTCIHILTDFLISYSK